MSSSTLRHWFAALAIAAWVTAQLFAAAGAEAAELPRWQWPVQPAPANVTRLFDDPGPYAPGHRGIDVAATPGQAIFAVADGVVRFAGNVAGRPVVSVQHADGLISTYEPVITTATRGDVVTSGQQLGTLDALNQHPPSGGLHLGARSGTHYLDPLALLGAIPRAILLPLASSAALPFLATPAIRPELVPSYHPSSTFHTEQEPS